MLTRLRIQGFKSWADTGDIKLGKLTGFFGPNSSGKTSLLQFLLMLKQTVESTDRSRVLHTGDANSYVDLGTFYDIIHKHQVPGELKFEVEWGMYNADLVLVKDAFSATIQSEKNKLFVKSLSYKLSESDFVELELRNSQYWAREKGIG